MAPAGPAARPPTTTAASPPGEPKALVLPPSSPNATAGAAPLTREPARDTLAPSSFGSLSSGQAAPSAPASGPTRQARGPLNTLGDLEGATATATLRPPGAVPPPPRALPMPTPVLDAGLERGSLLDTPLPGVPLVGPAFVAQAAAEEAALDSTLDMSSTASKQARQAALVEQTRAPVAAVPAPGLFIADEPLEPRPKQLSLVSEQRQALTRLRVVMLVLVGLLLMLAGAMIVLIFRRLEAFPPLASSPAPSASAAPLPPGCRLLVPPSRISATIERSVPISAFALADGSVALGIADGKSTVAGWLYDPALGEPKRKLEQPAGSGDVSHVTANDPLLADRASPDFAFGQTLTPGLAFGVGPAGLLRRGDDGASGMVWPLAGGVRITPPRALAREGGYVITFRQGGAEGQVMLGWLLPDGSAKSELFAVTGAPKTLGTPSVAPAAGPTEALALFAARGDKSEPYRIFAARAAFGAAPAPAFELPLPAEGGGAIAPSLVALPGERYLVQWTDGNVGNYQVQTRLLDARLQPLGPALRVSAKGANAGQGRLVLSGSTAVSFFIQTTAGHDELWGASLTCH
ncbi:MAG TPA: hypothetical protein VIW29_18390 [Polyangiaceae bacterium]